MVKGLAKKKVGVATVKESAEALVQHHLKVDPKTQLILWVPDDSPTPKIRLLEVTPRTSYTGDYYAVEFSPTAEIPFTTVIMLLHPREWEMMKDGVLELPESWGDMEDLKKLYPNPKTRKPATSLAKIRPKPKTRVVATKGT